MLQQMYDEKKGEIKSRLADFSKINNKEDIFYELCFCLLTSGSNARRCDARVKMLKQNNFMNTNFMPRQHIRDIRFYNNKTENLLLAKKNYSSILDKLNSVKDNYQLREWLVNNVRGLGYKEASHFIRNIGKGKGLAILDRHILKNLKLLNVLENVPSHMSKKQYLDIEKRLLSYSSSIGIAAEELDLLLWSKETGEIFK